jgi:hypothetical protein
MSRRSKFLLVLLAFFGLFVYIWKEDKGAGLISLVKDLFK